MPVDLPEVLYRDLLLYSLWFSKMKNDPRIRIRIHGNPLLYLCLKNFGGRIYTNFSVFVEWIVWVIEGLLR